MSLENEINNYKRDFWQAYYSKILPLFKDYEIKRKKAFIKFWFFLILFLILTLLSLWLMITDTNGFWGCVIGKALIIPFFIATIVVPSFISFSIVSDIKTECIEKIVSVFGNVKWNGFQVSDYEMKLSELFKDFAGSQVDDYFSGIYRNVPFKATELYLYADGGSTTFKGVVLSFKVNKTIKNKTIIATKSDFGLRKHSLPYLQQIVLTIILLPVIISCFWAAFFVPLATSIILVLIGITLLILIGALLKECIDKFKNNSIVPYDKKLKQIKLEDPDFSKRYVAYSSDEVEGRYLITPAFMERFKNLQTAFGTNRVKCSFYGNNLMFAISTNKNLFEICSLFQSLDKPKQLEQFFDEMISIYLMIDYFKLDENTGL